jgi:FdhD protein
MAKIRRSRAVIENSKILLTEAVFLDNSIHAKTILRRNREKKPDFQDLICEEPLSIRIQGSPYSVIMRTPGDESAHAAGFCLAEGIVDAPGDIVSLAFCDGADSNVVTVTLTPARQKTALGHLDRREYISQSSCGICGKQIVDELRQELRPIEKETRIDFEKGKECLENLDRLQPLREKTRAAHAAAIFDENFRLLSVAEDVGRHNALDKAVGRLFLDGELDKAAFLALSSRISYELVQKAARARIPVVLAMSRPTALAVSLASSLNMALASLAKGGGLFIYCGENRLI